MCHPRGSKDAFVGVIMILILKYPAFYDILSKNRQQISRFIISCVITIRYEMAATTGFSSHRR